MMELAKIIDSELTMYILVSKPLHVADLVHLLVIDRPTPLIIHNLPICHRGTGQFA